MIKEEYGHYLKLSKEDLILLIEKNDTEINNFQKVLKETKESRDKYYSFNKFHMEEITRLDKIIGKYKKI